MAGLRFLCDENIPRSLGLVAQSLGYDVCFLVDLKRGEADERVLELATRDGRILITEDADFGRLIFSDLFRADGVVLIRIAPWMRELREARLRHLLLNESRRLTGHFTVLNERNIRMRPISHDGQD